MNWRCLLSIVAGYFHLYQYEYLYEQACYAEPDPTFLANIMFPPLQHGPTRVLGFGSNLFYQINATHPLESSPERRYLLEDAESVVAVSTYQTIYRTRSGEVKVLGESARLLEKLVAGKNASKLVFVGQDIVEVVLDGEGKQSWLLDYETEQATEVQGGWKSAVADGRGRIMAVDSDGAGYLFNSIRSFKDATGVSDSAKALRQESKFIGHTYDEATNSTLSKQVDLPKFTKISAGNAHFVLLSEPDSKWPVWEYGDARFGAVPLTHFANTTLVGILPSNSSSSAPPTDVPYLMPVPYFSPLEGFPEQISDIATGARHSLIRTIYGDVYGWGWNEHSQLLPLNLPPNQEEVEWETNIVSDPALVDMSLPNEGHGADHVSVRRIAAAGGRSFALLQGGELVVSGSNEFNALGLGGEKELQGLKGRERKGERSFSQIKREFECVDGMQVHPDYKVCDDGGKGGKVMVVDVHATSLATFLTLAESLPTNNKEV